MMLRRKLFSWLKLWLVQLEKLKYGVIFDDGLEKLEKEYHCHCIWLEKLDFR